METTIKHVNMQAVEHAADLIEQASWILEKADNFIGWCYEPNNKKAMEQEERYYQLRRRLNSVLEDLGTTLGHEDTEHWLPF